MEINNIPDPYLKTVRNLSRRDFVKGGGLLCLGLMAPYGLNWVAKMLNPILSAQNEIPDELKKALHYEYGDFKSVVSADQFLHDLESSDVACVAESHLIPEDMDTAFEIAQIFASRHKIFLAVERLSNPLQNNLNDIQQMENRKDRVEAMGKVLSHEEYVQVWGSESQRSLGYMLQPEIRSHFEQLVTWAAGSRIPIIALDISLKDRQNGFGENIPYRNQQWVSQLRNFLTNYGNGQHKVLLIGGLAHIDETPNSVPAIARSDGLGKVISVGQRNGNIDTSGPTSLTATSKKLGISEVIIEKPQYAIKFNDGSTQVPVPPNYWVSLHHPGSWYAERNPTN